MGSDYIPSRKDTIRSNTHGSHAANATFYYSTDGNASGAEAAKGDIIITAGILRELRCRTQIPPGAGETYVYTVFLNGAPTALVVTIAGAVALNGFFLGAIPVVADDRITIRIVSSLNAAVSNHSWAILHQY